MNRYYAIIYENPSHRSGANRKNRLDFQIKWVECIFLCIKLKLIYHNIFCF